MYARHPADTPHYRAMRRFDSLAEPIHDSDVYWRLAPRVHRRLLPTETSDYRAPLDPFKVEWVDPDRIVRFTRREHPTWFKKWELSGAVAAGDWDTDRPYTLIDGYGRDREAYRRDYVGDRFTATTFHRSLRSHFLEGVPWAETALVRNASRLADGAGHPWASSEADIRRKCERIAACSPTSARTASSPKSGSSTPAASRTSAS